MNLVCEKAWANPKKYPTSIGLNWNKVLWAGQDNELAMAMRKQQKKSIEDSK